MIQRSLYIVVSPFQFFAAILNIYEKKDNALLVYLKYSQQDMNCYQDIINKLDLHDLIECIVVQSNSRLKTLLYAYKNIVSKNIKKEFAYIGDHYNRLSRLLGNIFCKKLLVLGDGSGIIWGSGNTLYYNKFLFEVLPSKLFGFQTFWELERTIDKNIFTKQWKFINDKYKQLEIRDEIWIVGSSTPFVKLFNLNVYSKISSDFLKEADLTEEYYFNQIEKVLHYFNKHHSHIYFPHRAEKLCKKHYDIGLNINKLNIPLEFVPLYLGYLPKVIVGSSTTIFSYLNFKNILKKNFDVYAIHQSCDIDNVYKHYGANILYIDGLS